jgi:hypothetical protein
VAHHWIKNVGIVASFLSSLAAAEENDHQSRHLRARTRRLLKETKGTNTSYMGGVFYMGEDPKTVVAKKDVTRNVLVPSAVAIKELTAGKTITSPAVAVPDDQQEQINTPLAWSALSEDKIPRPLKILSFGTSQTYGRGIADRTTQSYPLLITPYQDHVDNLGLPATAADHPSLCLQSMIPDADTKSYDLIMFEYPFNQSDGSRLLLRRLRERYPEAVIVFVNIWNLVSQAREQDTQKILRDPDFANLDNEALFEKKWTWKGDGVDTFSFNVDYDKAKNCQSELCHVSELNALLEEVGGHYFAPRRPASVHDTIPRRWFVKDWHRLSLEGHRYVASELARLLATQSSLWTQAFKPHKALGLWKGGDRCYNWAYSGIISEEHLKVEGAAELVEQHPEDYGATIEFLSD